MFLHRVLSNDVAKIAEDGAQDGFLSREDGGVLDDLFSHWTGISQPAKGTSRAPAATWRPWSGVRSRASAPAAISARI